ncbi:unnamed protein product [Pleuronectes platessa]|uniref:Uncharacterized protein n=1 Tax=Pleuronectes platessa TaxID=8262 RepID=A0A9N7UXP4_PLEPL|nr:unnamed protein product [Pleuronectes platessa]
MPEQVALRERGGQRSRGWGPRRKRADHFPPPSLKAKHSALCLELCRLPRAQRGSKLGTQAESCDSVRGFAALAPPVSSLLILLPCSHLRGLLLTEVMRGSHHVPAGAARWDWKIYCE